jgi:predicted PurR-regulated permease PerM
MNISSQTVNKRLFLLFGIIAGLYFAREFLMPLAVAGLLAALFLPMCRWMERKGMNRLVAAIVCVILLLLVIAGIFTLIGWQVSELAQDFSSIKQKGTEAVSKVQESIYSKLGITEKKQKEVLEKQGSNAGGMVTAITGSLVAVFTGFILMSLYIVLLLYYRAHLKEFVLRLAPQQQKPEVRRVLEQTAEVSHQYLMGLTKMIMCLWVMYGIGFSLLGVKNAIFFAILCGVLEIIPFIGNITGTTITVLVAAIQGSSPAVLGGILGVYLLAQFIQGSVLQPIIVGPQVKINAFATVVALVLGELIWGIPGIMLAIPLTGMFKIVCDHIEPLKPYGFLIGEIKSTDNPRLKKFMDKIWKKITGKSKAKKQSK